MSTRLMVRLTPSTVTEPLGARRGRRSAARRSPDRAPRPSRGARRRADAVDVAGDQVAAQRIAQPQRPLEVDARAGLERAEGRERQRLGPEIGRERPRGRARRPSGRRRRRRCWRPAAATTRSSSVETVRRAAGTLGPARAIDSTVPMASTMPVNMKPSETIAFAAVGCAGVIARSHVGGEQQIGADGRAGIGPRRSARPTGETGPGRDRTPPPSSCGATNSATPIDQPRLR